MAKMITKEQGTAADYINEIERYEKEYQNWQHRGDSIVKRYRDERSESSNVQILTRQYNILWANTETLKPTLYARAPKVQVQRRYKDTDPAGRIASEIAERAGNYLIDVSDYDNVMRACVMDFLLPGRAVPWVNYRANFADPESPMDSEETVEGARKESKKEAEKEPKAAYAETGDGYGEKEEASDEDQPSLDKIRETVTPIYVGYKDFGHSPVRTWQEVQRAWRICRMTREQLIKRWPDKGENIPLNDNPEDKNDQDKEADDKADIYEIWDKEKRKVCWVSKNEKDVIEAIDPPVELQDFWPFPRPIWATLTNETLIPVPLYALYQDQAAELDKLTNRIGRFTDGLKLAGVYDASVSELQRILSPVGSPDNALIAVSNYTGFKEKGGLLGAVDILPVEMIANTLLSLYNAREQVLSVIYQITGLADIIRGASNPNETATAQSIKGQFASLRIKDSQAEIARLARDTSRIMVEMAVEMYEPDTLYEMVMAESFTNLTPREQQQAQILQQFGLPVPKPREEFDTALRLLRDEKMRSFHIDIETDSTVALDEREEKAAVTEFLSAFGSFVTGFLPVVGQFPALAPVAGEALLYATRRYRAGRQLEDSIEKAVAQLVQAAGQPQPNPAQIKAEAEAQKDQAEAQIDAQKLQLTAQKNQGELAVKQGNLALKKDKQDKDFALDQRAQQFDEAVDTAKLENDIVFQ